MRGTRACLLRKLALAGAGSLLIAGCGSSNQASRAPVQQAAATQPLVISTASLPAGVFGEFYSVTLQATGGVGRLTWDVTQGALPSGLNLDRTNGVISGIITDSAAITHQFIVTATDSGSRLSSKQFDLSVSTRPEKILTTALPDGLLRHKYKVQIATTQPGAAIRVSSSSPGGLPPGIGIGANQTLNGVATQSGSFPFVLQILDASGNVADQRSLSINVNSSGNRNDDTANATTLSSGSFFASISPFADPVSTGNPDNDYYKFQVQPGGVLSVELFSEREGSALDSILEIVDSSGLRLATCNQPGESGFAGLCFNNDNLEDFTLDSKLLFKATGNAPVTVFVHILDWRGDARPDMEYELQVFGAD